MTFYVRVALFGLKKTECHNQCSCTVTLGIVMRSKNRDPYEAWLGEYLTNHTAPKCLIIVHNLQGRSITPARPASAPAACLVSSPQRKCPAKARNTLAVLIGLSHRRHASPYKPPRQFSTLNSCALTAQLGRRHGVDIADINSSREWYGFFRP